MTIPVGGTSLGGLEDGCGSLQCGFDDIEFGLQIGCAADLHVHLALLAPHLDALCLDEMSMFLKLVAQCAPTGHAVPLLLR